MKIIFDSSTISFPPAIEHNNEPNTTLRFQLHCYAAIMTSNFHYDELQVSRNL